MSSPRILLIASALLVLQCHSIALNRACAQESAASGEIERTIRRYFKSMSERDVEALRAVLDTRLAVIEAVAPISRVHVKETANVKETLPPQGSHDWDKLKISDVKAKTSTTHPSLAIASFTVTVPLDAGRSAGLKRTLEGNRAEVTGAQPSVASFATEGSPRSKRTQQGDGAEVADSQPGAASPETGRGGRMVGAGFAGGGGGGGGGAGRGGGSGGMMTGTVTPDGTMQVTRGNLPGITGVQKRGAGGTNEDVDSSRATDDRAIHNSMFAMLARQHGKWKIICVSIPELSRPASGQGVPSDIREVVRIPGKGMGGGMGAGGSSVGMGSRSRTRDGASKEELSRPSFRDQPAAHALYDRMAQTIRKADTLYYESDYRMEYEHEEHGSLLNECSYKLWAKKPHFARLEAASADGKKKGVLVADGTYTWVHWPSGRPRFQRPLERLEGGVGENDRFTSYLQFPAPRWPDSVGDQRRLSVGTRAQSLGTSLVPIVNPSVLHGYSSPGERRPAVRSLGTEKVGEEECDVIELSHSQLSITRFWVSRRDHLPRKLKKTIRIARSTNILEELWSNVRINEKIASDQFRWQPPEGWTRYCSAAQRKSLATARPR